MQRMRMLDMLDNDGRLTTMGSSKLSFDFSPEWARALAKAREHGILEGAINIAAVLSREAESCTMQTMDGDIMSLLQSINVRELPWNGYAASALGYAGFKPRTLLQTRQNIAQISETMVDSGLPMGKVRPRTDKYYGALMLRAFWEGFHMQVMMRGITGRYASPVYGGEWTTGRTTLAYSPLFLLPEKGHR